MNDEERKEKKERILEALKDSMGNIGVACKVVKIARKTFYNWKEADEEFKVKAEEIFEEQKSEMDDYAEGKLFQHIRNDNITALIFYLKTRHPGYRLKGLLEIGGKIKVEKELSEDDKELLKKAIGYAIGEATGEDNK